MSAVLTVLNTVVLVEADTGAVLPFQVTDPVGNPLSLVGYESVTLKYAINGTNQTPQTCTVTNAIMGLFQYEFTTVQLSAAGTLELEVMLTDGSGHTLTARDNEGNQISIPINARLF